MKPHKVILIGGGGHAKSLAEFSESLISGYLSNEKSSSIPGDWLGSDSVAPSLVKEGNSFHMAFIYSGWPIMEKRRELIKKYEKLGAGFSSLISPTSIVTPNSTIGEGCAVMSGAIVNRARLGRHVVVNSGAIVEHDCEIGNNTFIGPGAVIGGYTKIGENCFIGLGARVGNDLEIGANITIAMGAIVTHNLTEPGIYHGNPLKLTKLPKSKL